MPMRAKIKVMRDADRTREARRRVKLTCNIDDRGAKARRIWGACSMAVGLVLGGAALAVGTWWLWIAAGAGVGAGAFAFYEAKKKWCVMRAMGVRTPM
jgi:hypothetical protein